MQRPELLAKVCSVTCLLVDRQSPTVLAGSRGGDVKGAPGGGGGGGGGGVGVMVAILDYLAAPQTAAARAYDLSSPQCEKARVGLLKALVQQPLAGWSPEVAAHLMQVVGGEGSAVCASRTELDLAHDALSRIKSALLFGASSRESWDAKHVTAIARFLLLHHQWEQQQRPSSSAAAADLCNEGGLQLRGALARRVTELLQRGAGEGGRGVPSGRGVFSLNQMATVAAALASFYSPNDVSLEQDGEAEVGGGMGGLGTGVDAVGGAGRGWQVAAMRALGAGVLGLAAPASAAEVRDVAMVMTALAKADLLSPTSALASRQGFVERLVAAHARNPAAFTPKNAASLLYSLAMGLPRASGAPTNVAWAASMEQEASLCDSLLGVLKREAHWNQLPVTSLGKILSAVARLYRASHFPHAPAGRARKGGGSGVGKDVHAVAAAASLSVLARDDADLRQHSWAVANIVYGVSAILAAAPAAAEANAVATVAATPTAASGVGAATTGRNVGLSEISTSELDLRAQVLGKMAGVVGQQEAAALAGRGSRAIRDLTAAFASALAERTATMSQRAATKPTAVTVASVVSLLCEAAALVPESGRGNGAEGEINDDWEDPEVAAARAGTMGGVRGGWSTMDAALTLRSGAAVAEALERRLLPASSLRAALIKLGDVTVGRLETQLQLPRVRVAAVAAVTDVLVAALVDTSGPLAVALAGKGWLRRVYDAFLGAHPANFAASVDGIAQMLAALVRAQRSGLVSYSPTTGTRVRERLSVMLLSMLQPPPDLPSASPGTKLLQPSLAGGGAAEGAGGMMDGAAGDSGIDGTKGSRSGGGWVRGSGWPEVPNVAGIGEQEQVQLLADLTSALQSLRSLASLARGESSSAASAPTASAASDAEAADIALVCDAVLDRAAQLVRVRRSPPTKGDRQGGAGGSGSGAELDAGNAALELRFTVKLLRVAAELRKEAGSGSKQGRRDRHKQYIGELVAQIQGFDAAAATGVVVADVCEAAVAAGAASASLLLWVARMLADMPLAAWRAGPGGQWDRGAGASLARILAAVITLQNRVLARYPRHRRLVMLPRDQDAQTLLAAAGRVRLALAGVVVQLPADALSAKNTALLAYGMSRAGGTEGKLLGGAGASADKGLGAVVRHLADIAAGKLLQCSVGPGGQVDLVVDGGGMVDVVGISTPPQPPSTPPSPFPSAAQDELPTGVEPWDFSARDCALLAGAMMKSGISGHAAWPLLATHASRRAGEQPELRLADACYLADALMWEARVGGRSPLVVGALRALQPVFAQSLLRSLRSGVPSEAAYQVTANNREYYALNPDPLPPDP